MTSDVFRDRWVGYRSATTIKLAVQNLLASCGLKGLVTFNIVELIKKHLTRLPGGLKIELYDQGPGQPEAFVSYKPLTLHVDREIWRDANLGEPRARYILAHEVGHIVLHRVDADLGFSEGSDAQLRAPPEERSAEWQANVFAHFLLVPDEALVVKMPLMHKAADINVPSYVIATVQLFDSARDIFTFVAAPPYTGDPCGDCGNLTLSRLGFKLGLRYVRMGARRLAIRLARSSFSRGVPIALSHTARLARSTAFEEVAWRPCSSPTPIETRSSETGLRLRSPP